MKQFESDILHNMREKVDNIACLHTVPVQYAALYCADITADKTRST